MLKVVALIKRKSGLSKEAFRDYYETQHAPLIMSSYGEYFAGYRRSYLLDDNVGADPETAGFDVITEVLVKDRSTLNELFARASEPQIAERIAADEEKFVDRSAVRMYVAEEQTG